MTRMGFTDAISSGFSTFTDFSGRASRSEFWWWVLFLWLVSLVAGILDHVTNLGFDDTHTFARVQYGGWITLVAVLILAIPTLAVTVRRLHDAGSSGWWVLMYFICCLGALALYIMCLRGSQSGANKYGPPPGVTA